jgi:hypothetical protein
MFCLNMRNDQPGFRPSFIDLMVLILGTVAPARAFTCIG